MPNPHDTTAPPLITSRRGLFHWASYGLTGAALSHLLIRDGLVTPAWADAPTPSPTPQPISGEADDPPPHIPAKAKSVIHICLCGGLSHLDSFDHKPALDRLHGKPLPTGDSGPPETFFGKVGLLRRHDWEFRPRGRSGLMISELFPHIAQQADHLTIIRSMVADSANHTPATFQQNTGFRLNGFPVMGAWLSYGLGCATDQLPAYVVLPDARGLPAGSTINWSNGFLPARHQGVPLRTRGPAIDDLNPARPIPQATSRQAASLLEQLNTAHLAAHDGSDALAARIRSYQLAAKMQLAIPEVTDLSGESPAIREMYGLESPHTADFARSCLLARRLCQRGVRFVQLFSGGSFGSPRINWDGHENVKANHTQEARRIDKPVAALLADLRQCGLWDSTLVLFTTEFGRTPFTESAANVVGAGRDHNMHGFSVWMAGAGLKPGIAYGQTDEVGWKAVVNPVAWHDFHATVLHLLGIDHERLSYYHNGIRRRLTNVHGHVIHELLA